MSLKADKPKIHFRDYIKKLQKVLKKKIKIIL